MVKTYYRSEYSDKQWKALIDKAAELGCQVTYSRYGDCVEIDSTDQENAVLQESTDLRRWKVQPKRHRKGYCPTICKSQESAEHEKERFERMTGFEWTIKVISE